MTYICTYIHTDRHTDTQTDRQRQTETDRHDFGSLRQKNNSTLYLQFGCRPQFTKCLVYSICFQIHWFSIFNSFMMVIFLVGLVSMILMRTLRKDYARYSKDDELDDMVRKYHKFNNIHWLQKKEWNDLNKQFQGYNRKQTHGWCDSGALLYQLSYEAMTQGWK